MRYPFALAGMVLALSVAFAGNSGPAAASAPAVRKAAKPTAEIARRHESRTKIEAPRTAPTAGESEREAGVPADEVRDASDLPSLHPANSLLILLQILRGPL